MSYLTIGFNENLIQQDNIPQALNPQAFLGFTSEVSGDQIGSTFDGQYVGSGIKANNITTGEMSFDRVKGGTLTLGGIENTNGILSTNDDLNQEILKIDKTGLTTNKGNLIAKNNNDQTILDSSGIVSTTAFKIDRVAGVNQIITSTTSVDIVGLSINTINFKRPTVVLILFESLVQLDASDGSSYFNGNGVIQCIIDGSAYNSIFMQFQAARTDTYTDGVTWKSVIGYTIITLGKGSHALQMQGSVSSGGALNIGVGVGQNSLTYIAFGT